MPVDWSNFKSVESGPEIDWSEYKPVDLKAESRRRSELLAEQGRLISEGEQAQQEAESLASQQRTYEFFNRPDLGIGNAIGQAAASASGYGSEYVPATQVIPESLRLHVPEDDTSAIAGVGRAAANFINSSLEPGEALKLLAFGGGAVPKLVAAAPLALQTPEAIARAVEVSRNPQSNPANIGEAVTEAAIPVAMIAGVSAGHGAQRPVGPLEPPPEVSAAANRAAVNLAAPGTVRPSELQVMGIPDAEAPQMFQAGEVPFQSMRRFGSQPVEILDETRPKVELETRGKVSFGAEAPTLVRTAIDTGHEVGLTKSAEALAEVERKNASSQPSTASVPEPEVRPRVGEETSLRQPGETPGAQLEGPETQNTPAIPEAPKVFDEVTGTHKAWDFGAEHRTPEGIGRLAAIEADLVNQLQAVKASDLPTTEKANQRAALALRINLIREALSAARNETDRPLMNEYFAKQGEHPALTQLREFKGDKPWTGPAMELAKQIPKEQIPKLEKLAEDAAAEAMRIIDEVEKKGTDATPADLKRMSEAGNRQSILAEALRAAKTGEEPATLAREKAPETPPEKPAEPGRDWDKLYEDLVAELDSFNPARETGKINHALNDVAQRFVEFAKANPEKSISDSLKAFAKQDEANAGQISKLRQSLKNIEKGPDTGALGEVGMGAAKPAELGRPTISELIPPRETGAKPGEPAPEAPRPGSVAGIIDNVLSLFTPEGRGSLAPKAKGLLGTISGQTLPKITLANRGVGELGARYLSSQIAAPRAARLFSHDVTAGLNVDPVKFGAALSEDNLRSVFKANPEAGGTFSFVGEGKPFRTEAEYQAFLKQPNVQEAIRRHIANWNAVVEPMYRDAMQTDPDAVLPSRGEQTGARVNLAAILEDKEVPGSPSGSPVGGMLNTLRKKSPFGVKAKGTGEAYVANYDDLIANTFFRQLETANKNVFDNALVEKGLAVIDKPGQKVEIGGRGTVAFPLKRKTLVSKGQAIPQNETLYVREDLAREYRNASNVDDNPYRNFIVNKLNSGLNQAALAGLTDATVHLTNLSTSLAQLPVSKLGLLTDSLLAAAGRLDIPVAGLRAVQKGAPEVGRALLQRSKVLRKVTPDAIQRSIEDAFWKNQNQLATLAEIGAAKGEHAATGIPVMRQLSDVIQWYDRTTRMVLDDAYQDLAARGIVENSETARREFINQVGQYNKRAQGVIVRLSRDLGTGPFVTAGRAFNILGTRAATLSPGVKATSFGNAAMLRANSAARWLGTLAFVGMANYLLTGHLMGRKGTPVGSIDTGTNDEQGRMKSFSVMNLTGQGRALRVTGLRGAIEAKAKGLPNTVAADAAARDVINSWTAPLAGPPVKAAFVAASGFPPAIDVGRASKVVPPGQSQTLENLKQAAVEANPVVAGIAKSQEPGKTWEEAVRTQLPRFTLQTKQPEKMIANYPAIVRRAQANAYMEDVIHRARYIEDATERRDYVRGALKQLDPQDREHAKLTLRFRKIEF